MSSSDGKNTYGLVLLSMIIAKTVSDEIKTLNLLKIAVLKAAGKKSTNGCWALGPSR